MNQTLFPQETAVELFCKKTGFTFEELSSKRRFRPLVVKRMIFADYMIKHGYTFEYTGKIIGKDHSTIVHYKQNFDCSYNYDKEFRELYDRTQLLLNA